MSTDPLSLKDLEKRKDEVEKEIQNCLQQKKFKYAKEYSDILEYLTEIIKVKKKNFEIERSIKEGNKRVKKVITPKLKNIRRIKKAPKHNKQTVQFRPSGIKVLPTFTEKRKMLKPRRPLPRPKKPIRKPITKPQINPTSIEEELRLANALFEKRNVVTDINRHEEDLQNELAIQQLILERKTAFGENELENNLVLLGQLQTQQNANPNPIPRIPLLKKK